MLEKRAKACKLLDYTVPILGVMLYAALKAISSKNKSIILVSYKYVNVGLVMSLSPTEFELMKL